MAGLDAKLGGLISSVGHLNDSVEELKRSTQKDHDDLTGLRHEISEWKRTLFKKVDEVEGKAEKAIADAIAVKAYAEKLVNDFRKEIEAHGNVKSDRTFQIIMAVGAVALSLVTSWITLKLGLSGR